MKGENLLLTVLDERRRQNDFLEAPEKICRPFRVLFHFYKLLAPFRPLATPRCLT